MAEMSNPVDVMGRELPYSQEAELAVIGSALTNSHSVAESVEILRPSDFYFPQNKEIFRVILDLFNENRLFEKCGNECADNKARDVLFANN